MIKEWGIDISEYDKVLGYEVVYEIFVLMIDIYVIWLRKLWKFFIEFELIENESC